MRKELEEEEEKARRMWICTYCGEPHETKKQAEQCWESHEEWLHEFIFGGIGAGEEPVEIIRKKIEKGYITRIATYVLKDVKEVKREVKKVD